MPRRKAADRAGQVKTRSRSGCRECRASRVRCDAQRPICTRCREKGLPCSTNLVLKWESEFVSRGMAFGRTGVWSKNRSDSSPSSTATSAGSSPGSSVDDTRQWCSLPGVESWAFINTGMASFEDRRRFDVNLNRQRAIDPRIKSRAKVMPVGAWNLGPSSAPSAFPGRLGLENPELFDYFFRQLCPRATASPSSSSPFASVVLPFSTSATPTLFKAIEALSACHWAQRDPKYSTVGLRLKTETLRDLRRRLASQELVKSYTDPEILLIMMMLCLYEIMDKCDERWTVHLKGAKDLIRLRRERVGTPSDPVTRLAERFFAFQDVMGRTACGEAIVFGNDYWSSRDQKIDLWMGCSTELAGILSMITEMSRARRLSGSIQTTPLFLSRAASLQRQLEHLVQEVEGGDDNILSCVAEAKRLAALLYLHCALHGAAPSTAVVVDYVHQILCLVSSLLDFGSMANVMWPIFVAGVELDPSRDELYLESDGPGVSGRSVILRALDAMADSSISNVSRTRGVIIEVWQARDQDLLKPPKSEVNDWDRYVAPVSSSMSLA
ncbi:hypothetical protein N7539_005978 [Penicillium diatomitis]|uniref:Zn(2)-C6 fungal-type domain-containing protein n=1 Tax=Penicillium diatomitis TaxID=2819901 RepID=A0A9W9X5A3_9EURO|nr:uncharacterized protein N7539_005978 [Penicillium diatomitis]KAJ5484182.1 hypothetical protein N7539_005978 [Penicillium diatomitis]